MKKKILAVILLTCICLIVFIFIEPSFNKHNTRVSVDNYFSNNKNNANNENSIHKNSSFNVIKNSPTEAEITIDLFSLTYKEPSINILSENEPVFSGERKKADPTLGKYRIELLFNDARVLDKVRDDLKLDTAILHRDKGEIAQSARMAYPPDDSMSVLYIGCSEEPIVNLEAAGSKLKIKISISRQ